MHSVAIVLLTAYAVAVAARPMADLPDVVSGFRLVARDNATAPAKPPTPPETDTLPFLGVAQWTAQNGQPGACGVNYKDDDAVVIINKALYGRPDGVSPMCGLKVWVDNALGQSIMATIADVCEGDDCGDEHSLVLTKGLFTALGGNLDRGINAVYWGYDKC